MSDPTKAGIRTFWSALQHSFHGGVEPMSRHDLMVALDALEDMFRIRGHGAVVEMPVADLAGKRVLEIGSGNGGHSALFAKHGAIVSSVDLTRERVEATAQKFTLLGADAAGCLAVQADAESLPFADNTFDIVYSNGVLHHTLDTRHAIAETRRVLKPGGRAVVMLYCKSSWHYWFNMVLCVGILQGKIFRSNWLGRATEWGGRDWQTVANPITRCFTRREMLDLFDSFEVTSLRKTDFYFYLIPKLGRIYRRWQIKRYGTHPGGYLVYGEPWPLQSPLEVKLGRVMGFSWWIVVEKPD